METKQFTELFGHVGYLFTDFSHQDPLSNNETKMEYSSSTIGLQIASHFFFGVHVEKLTEVLSSMNATAVIKQFTLDKVLLLISKQYASQKPILLTLQLDEFSQVPLSILKGIISFLAVHMTSHHHLQVCILPQLSGTSTKIVIQEMQNFSKIVHTPLLLSLLLQSPDMTKLTESALQGTGFKYLLQKPLFLQAVNTLGGVPRFLQYFIDGFQSCSKELQAEPDYSKILHSVLHHNVVDAIHTTYFTKLWKQVLGGSLVGVQTMLLWAFSGQKVQLSDKLNGITVESACNTGALLLQEVKEGWIQDISSSCLLCFFMHLTSNSERKTFQMNSWTLPEKLMTESLKG